MNKKFKSANLKSPGLISAFLMLLVLSGCFLFAAFNLVRNNGPVLLLAILLFFGLAGPVLSFLHTTSYIRIDGDQLIKKSIFRTKKCLIKDFQSIHVTETVIGKTPKVSILESENIKKESWLNIFTLRHINICKDKSFNPYSFKNSGKVVSLPYYTDLYEVLKIKIKTTPQHKP